MRERVSPFVCFGGALGGVLILAVLSLTALRSFAGVGPGGVHVWGNDVSSGRPRGLADVILLKVSEEYTYVLRSNKTIVLWGSAGQGQLDAPPGLSNVCATAAGSYMPMALTDDGKVHVWGARGHVSEYAIVHPPASVTNVTAIAAGVAHCLALRGDGTVVAWGDNLFRQTNVPPTLSNVVQIAAGYGYSLAVTSAGEIVTWGNTEYYGAIPSAATNLTDVALSMQGHGLGLRGDGTVVTWGSYSFRPAEVPSGLSGVVAIAAGGDHSLALKGDGSVVAWGLNPYGAGVVPTDFVRAKAVAAAPLHNAVISDAPLVEDVSRDQQVADGSDLRLEALVTGSLPWSSVWYKNGTLLEQTNSMLLLHDVGSVDTGVYWLIASNEFGFTRSRDVDVRVYRSAPQWRSQPENQAVLPGQAAIFVADAFGTKPLRFQWEHDGKAVEGATNATLLISSVAVMDEGAYTVRVLNEYGSITSERRLLAATLPRLFVEPTSIRARTNWVISLDVEALSPLPVGYRWFKGAVELPGETTAHLRFPSLQEFDAGDYQVEVRNEYGAVRSRLAEITVLPSFPSYPEPGVVVEWGNAPFSQLSVLREVTNAVAIAAGMWHTLVLCQDGTLRIWGDPQDLSLLAIPPEATNVADIFAGPSHNLVLRKDGTVVCWGSESAGFGRPTVLQGLSNVVSAAGRLYDSLFLKQDGSVAILRDPHNVSANVTNIVAIAAPGEYSVGVQANGRVLTWGAYADGPNGFVTHEVPGLEGVIAAAAGGSYGTTVLRRDGTVAGWNSYPPDGWRAIEGITNAVAVAGIWGYGALLETGEVRTWGFIAAPPGLRASRIASGVQRLVALTPAPFLDSHPRSQTLFAGGNGVLEAEVRSATPMSLQWYFEGAPIPAATNAVLQFVSAKASQSGRYELLARNLHYETRSQTAFVTVEGPAEFVYLSDRQDLLAGEALRLDASYVGIPTASAQWHLNGLPIPGATNSSFLQPHAAEWMTGSYTLMVSNAYGVVSSPVIKVVVSPAAPSVVTQPFAPDQVADGTLLELQVAAIGSEPFSYQWFFNDSRLEGETHPLLRLEQVALADNGVYRVNVSNGHGSAESNPVRVSTFRAAPSPEILPANLLVREGKKMQLQALARGTSGVSYQWRFKGSDLPGETNDVLVVPMVAPEPSGAYSVTAANRLGSKESTAVQVRVLPNPGAGFIKAWGVVKRPPDRLLAESVAVGDRHALALLPDGSVNAWGANFFSQASVPTGLSNAVAVAAGWEFSLALRSDGTVVGWGRDNFGQASPPSGLQDVVAISAGSTHALALKGDGSVVAWGEANFTTVPSDLPPIVSIAGAPGYSLALASDGTVRAWGMTYPLALTNVPLSITNVFTVAGGSDVAYALDRSGLAKAWPTVPSWPLEATNLIAISAAGQHAVALRADGRLFAWGNNDYGQTRGPRGVSNILSIAAGEDTTVAISAEPMILSRPADQIVKEDSKVVLSVDAIGTSPLWFQWFLNGQPLTGRTNTALTIASFTASDEGAYAVEVKNALASVKTNTGTFSLGVAPLITMQPADQTVALGSNATFTVQCSGTPKLNYQWTLNGTNLLAATDSSLTVQNVLFQDQGRIAVRISNPFGTATSREVELEVLSNPIGPSQLSLAVAEGSLRIGLTIQPTRRYSLLTSTNLIDWVQIQTIIPAGRSLELIRPVTEEPVRLYRLMELNP